MSTMPFSDYQPLVSVCMPAYNSEKYIGAAIESVLNQTYKNIELIITNDGSTDGTGEILAKYANLPNVKVVEGDRKGPSAACNLAFSHAKGEFIKFLDSDDLLSDKNVAVQVQKLLDHPNCIAAGRCKRFYNNDIATALHEPLACWQDLRPIDWLVIDNGKGLFMMQNGMFLIPRQLLENSGLWNEQIILINDFEFFPRVFLRADWILFTEEAKVYYRSGLTNGVSSTINKARLLSAYTALDLTTSLLLRHEDSDRVRSVLFSVWDMWKHSFYLDEMNLYRKTLDQMKRLGHYPSAFKGKSSLLVKLIGWKNEKRIQKLIKRS
jgi:glycosyltransferase involved in cell wall biosynthesis